MKANRLFTLLLCISLSALSFSVFAQTKLVVKKTGVGPIRVGMPVSEIPAKVEGLYDRIERVESEDEMDDFVSITHNGMVGGEMTIQMSEFDGKVFTIEIYSKSLKTEKGFGVGATPAQLFKAGADVLQDNSGAQGILLDGVLWIGHEYTASGMKKAEAAYLDGTYQKFNASDYKDSGARWLRINEYISTFKN